MTYWEQHEDAILIKMIVHDSATYEEVAQVLNSRTGESVRKRWNRIKNSINLPPSSKVVDIYNPVSLKSVVFDIEVMDFNTVGVTDHLVSCSFLPLDQEEPYSLTLKFEDNRNDARLLKEILVELTKYDILIGHNIAAFDLNWLFSRAMYYGMVMPKSWIYYDTYQVAKTLAIKTQKSLGALGAYFKLDGEKTRVLEADWSMIDSPIRAEFEYALNLINYHCNQDVILNKNLFFALWQYDPNKARSLKNTKW